jgi:hypothetical protein
MNDTNSLEVVGYIDPTLPGAKIVKPVLRDATNHDVFFFAEQPDKDIRSQVEGMTGKDGKGGSYLGSAMFRLLDAPLKYFNRALYVRQFGQVGLTAVTVFKEDLAEFDRTKAALNA